ncbi:MAG: bifunctional hydroxymethylpyrimidine kinase/phosphomethylpyrimidine kinase [Micromonosporaceae bacterium]|nr:bifunctional hydroxymethylpyrimidine kinase/phosphomethylpyrimidine kinase [Micromonosporaceae bacterium]
MIPNLLTIAGSDPSGGAGIQADLKTFAALGTYGMSAITGLTAQNTLGVRAVQAVPAEFVTAQLDSIFDDIRVDAVKIGMLGTAPVVRAVAQTLLRRRPPYLVLDPVMVAKSGDRLLTPDAVQALRDVLLPLADLVTPNLPEAAVLLDGVEARDESQMRSQLDSLAALGPGILLKGGHLSTVDSPDLLALPGAEPVRLTAPRVATRNSHGTGCTLSAAVAALRPQRDDWLSAVTDAKAYLTGALLTADELEVGSGHGPVHHMHAARPATHGVPS